MATTWSHEELYSLLTLGDDEELNSTLTPGDNEELESFLAEDLGGFWDRLETTHSLMEEYSPKVQPLKAEYIGKLEDVRVEESGSVCSICLDEMAKGSEVKRLPCCHMYHRNCIGEWLNSSNTCPLCRHQLPAS